MLCCTGGRNRLPAQTHRVGSIPTPARQPSDTDRTPGAKPVSLGFEGGGIPVVRWLASPVSQHICGGYNPKRDQPTSLGLHSPRCNLRHTSHTGGDSYWTIRSPSQVSLLVTGVAELQLTNGLPSIMNACGRGRPRLLCRRRGTRPAADADAAARDTVEKRLHFGRALGVARGWPGSP